MASQSHLPSSAQKTLLATRLQCLKPFSTVKIKLTAHSPDLICPSQIFSFPKPSHETQHQRGRESPSHFSYLLPPSPTFTSPTHPKPQTQKTTQKATSDPHLPPYCSPFPFQKKKKPLKSKRNAKSKKVKRTILIPKAH